MLKFKQNKDDGLPHVKVERTAEGTAFEIAIAALNIIMWGLIAWMWAHLPEQIPIHFDIAGRPDGYGSKGFLIVIGVISAFVTALMCFCAYHPRSAVSLPVSLSNAAQITLAVRLVRICGVFVSLIFITIVWAIGSHEPTGVLTICITVAMILVIAVFLAKIIRLK